MVLKRFDKCVLFLLIFNIMGCENTEEDFKWGAIVVYQLDKESAMKIKNESFPDLYYIGLSLTKDYSQIILQGMEVPNRGFKQTKYQLKSTQNKFENFTKLPVIFEDNIESQIFLMLDTVFNNQQEAIDFQSYIVRKMRLFRKDDMENRREIHKSCTFLICRPTING